MAEATLHVKVGPDSTVRPGDILLVPVGGVDLDTAVDVAEALRAQLPGVKVVTVAVDRFLIYRPGGDTDAQ